MEAEQTELDIQPVFKVAAKVDGEIGWWYQAGTDAEEARDIVLDGLGPTAQGAILALVQPIQP